MEDMDAALARALQEEEFAQARKHAGADQRASIFSQLQGCMDKVVKCEDELLHAMALSVMPLDDLNAEARAGEGEQSRVPAFIHMVTSHRTRLSTAYIPSKLDLQQHGSLSNMKCGG